MHNESLRTTRTNQSDSILIDPIHYKSIRFTTNRSYSQQIDPINYKSIRSTKYKSIRSTTNRSDPLQIDPIIPVTLSTTLLNSFHPTSYHECSANSTSASYQNEPHSGLLLAADYSGEAVFSPTPPSTTTLHIICAQSRQRF
jgi:hypothetical protein